MENTTIPLSFDISALQKQLDDITKMMNSTFASFGGKGHFKNLSTAMSSFKGSFGTINKSLKNIDSNLGSLTTNINNVLQETNKEINILQKGTKDSINSVEKLARGFNKVESEVSGIQSLLKKPISLNVDLGKADFVGPLEKQLNEAQQKINRAYEFKAPTEKKTISFIDETKIKNDVKVFENAYSEIKNSSDAMITYVRGTTRDILKHPMNSLEQFQNLWTRTIYNLQSHKTGREAVPLFTLTGSELGPISAAIEKLAEFRKVRRSLDVESLKSFENRPFEELAKSLSKSGFAYDKLIEAAKAFNVLEVTGERHIDATVKRSKEYKALQKAIRLYSEAMDDANFEAKEFGEASEYQISKVKKLKLAMDEARKSVKLKGEIVSVNALAGTLENLGDVASTKVTSAFHKLANSSKEIGRETWAKVFEAKDIEGFQKALVVLESKLGQVGKSNSQIEALYKNFSNIKQIAETHFAARMSAEFEEGASKSEKKIGELYNKITKLQSQVAKGELSQSALVGPFKALSKEVESLIKRSQVLNVSLDQIEQSEASLAMPYEGGPKPGSTESRNLATMFQEGVNEKQISSLSSLQSGLRGIVDQLTYANTELKVSEAAWVSWGEARKKIIFDLRKVTSEFEVPVESVSRTDIFKRHRQYADYQKQIDSLVKKRKLLGMVDKSNYSESISQMSKVLSELPKLNNLQEKRNQIESERKALLRSTAGKEKTREQIAELENLKKQYNDIKIAETEVANITLLIANEMDVLAKKSAFSPADIARISEFALELKRIDSLIKNISGKPSLSVSADVEALQKSLGTISKNAVPIKARITADQKAIDEEIDTLNRKFHAAMSKEPEVRTEKKTKTALQTIYSTQNAIGKLDKQLLAMTDSANVALRNIRMDEALDPKDAEQLMRPLQNLVSEFSELQKDILLIDESLTKLGSNPTEGQMQKTWSQLEPVFSNVYEKINLFSGVYDNLSKKQGGATAMTNSMVSSLERLMQKPARAAKSFDILIDSLLRAQGIAGKADLAKQLKSPDKAIREYAQKISTSIKEARAKLDVIAGEALGPEANKKIKQNIKKAEENYVKQVADAQKRAKRKLDALIKKAEAGPESKRGGAIGSAKAAFDREVSSSIISAKKDLEREKERILNIPVKLKPGVEADLVLKKWKSTIQALVTDFGQGGSLAAQRFQEMYSSVAGGFKFDQSLYNIASKTKRLLGQTGSFFKTMGSRSGDVLPLEEFNQLIKKQKQFQKEGALSTVALNPIIELGNVVSNTANVFDKMKLAVKSSASPEVIDSIQKEIDQFMHLRQISKDSTAQLSRQSKETRGLGFTMEKFGYAIDLLIQYLEKAINKFQGLGKTAHTALGSVESNLKNQAKLFKSSLGELEGPLFNTKSSGFKLTGPLENMFSEVYNSSLTSLQDLRKVTDKGLSAWSVSFKGGLSKVDRVMKQNGSALIGGLSKIRSGIKVAATGTNWGEILDPKGAELLRKSATGASLQIKELQADLAKFKTGKVSKISAFPTIKALQTQLKTVLSISEEVQRKLIAGELGMEHFPAVDRLQQYALQLTAAIDMIEKPYKSMKGLVGKEEKISTKQLGKSFRSGIIGAQKELEAATKQVKAPMKSVMVRLFEDVLSMTPTEIPQAAGMIRKLAEQFPSQMQSALNSMSKKKYEIGKFIAKMFSVDPSEFKTVEAAMEKRGAEIPKMLLKAIFPTEGQAKFAADAKKMANQIITAPLNKALRSAGEVTMPKFEIFRIGEEMMRDAKFEGEKFAQVKSQYGTYISDLINSINKLMKVSPSKTMKPILEKIFNASDVNEINAYANGMKGALSNIKDYLQKAVSGKLPKGQLAAGLGLQEELKKAGLEVDENELSQMFEQMYKMAGQSLKDFVAQEKRWSSNSIKDLIMLMEYWENLGGMVDMVTKKIPKVSSIKSISEVMFKGVGTDSIAAGRDIARLMVKSLESTLSEGSGIKQSLAAMIGKSPEIIFEIMRGTNQKLKNELKDLGFNLRGSTTDLVKNISKLGDIRVGTEWFEQYRLANERFYLEGEKTDTVLKRIRDGFNTITPLSSEGLSELATRSQDFLTRAGIAFESFDAKLFKHSVNFNAFSEKEKANVGKYTNILSKGMRTIGQFLQEDPFSGSIMRLVREEDVLWEKLIASADKGGKRLKMSIQSELARALDTDKREGINLDRLFKGTGKVPELQEIVMQLMELRKTKRAVDTEMMAPGVRPFSNLIKDVSLLQGTLLTAFGSISKGLSRVGETGKVDIKMSNSIRNLDTVTQHLNILQAEIDETIAYAKKTGQTLPLEFQLVTHSVSDMSSSLNSSFEILKKLPTHARVSEKDMEKLAETVNKSASALKKFDQIDLKEFSTKVGTAMSIAMNKVNSFSKQAQIKPSFQLGKTSIDQILNATGRDSEKIIQQWRESAVAGGDTWKQMILFLRELEPEMKGVFERFASKPRLLLKAFEKMTPQMRILMSLYFNEMGHSTAQGFQKWMQTYDKYFSGMTKTNKRHLETFLGYTSQTMASFKAPDVTKYFAPETGLEADKTTEGLKRLGNALSKLGINMKELKDLSGDTSWLRKWGEAFAKPIDWDFGPGKGKTIQLTGTFSMFGKAITQVGEGLDILMTQLRRVGEETQSGAIQKGIKQLVTLIVQLDSELSKTSKFKLSIGSGLSTSLKPLRDVGYAINSFFDAMEKIKFAADFTLTQKEINIFGTVVITTMNQIAIAINPAIKALRGFASTSEVKKFSQFAQGLRDLVTATKDLYQFTAVFSEIDKDSRKGATALGHFEKVIKSMMILLNSVPDISKKLNFGLSKDVAVNARMLAEVLKPLAQSMLMIGEAFKDSTNIENNMKRFSSVLKEMINVVRSVNLDPVTKDLLNDVRKLTQVFSSKALIAAPDEAEKRLQVLAQVIEQGSNKVAQKTKQGLQKMEQATKFVKQDFLSDLGVVPGKSVGEMPSSDLIDTLTSFSEPVPNFDASEQSMAHLAGAGKEVGKALQITNDAVVKLGSEFKEILPGEEKFIAELVQLAALNPAAAIDKLNIKLNSLDKNLTGDNLKKSREAIQGFIIELLNGAANLKSMGAAGNDLQKIHDSLNKDTVGAKELTTALTKVKGVLRSVEAESAKLDLQNRLLKTRGEAKSVHAEIKSLLVSMKAMGPEFKKSLSTGDARREFLSYANELNSKLETAMGPMRAFSGFKGVNEEIKKMTSSMAVLKTQSQGMVTLADRFTGKLRIAGDQFLNLVAYQTRWYVSQQIFFMGFGQLEKILSNFGALDKQIRRVLRVLRDSNNAVLGIDSSIRALSGAGVKWASDWSRNMEVMFKAQTRSTFYDLFKQLGATSEEIGESMYQLGSAGLQANEVMSAIEPTLRMIIATEGEVKDTTRLIAGVFNLYGDSIEGARTNTEKFVYITDVLTATFRDHMVTIGELITGISYTIATAKLSGMQFEEVTAALAVLNDNMLKGSKAGRAFNRMLLNSTKKLDETKNILQAIGSQANIGVDLTKVFEGLDASGARSFDYIIQAGIAMQDQLKTANLTVDNLTKTFKSMGVVGARAFAILLLKAGDYEKTLFQLKYAAFSAGEDMSNLLIGGFDRSIHRIEGFTRAGYARMLGIARGGVNILASVAQQAESTIKKVSEMPFIPDIPDAKEYISFFGAIATGAAVFAGIKKKPLPGLDALRFDKWAKGVNKFTLDIDQNRTALRLLNVELRKTGLNAISLGQAYETAANKMTSMGKVGSVISTFKGLTGLTSSFKPQQQLIISGLRDIERAYTKVTSGKWNMKDLTEFNSQMKSIAAFEPTFLAREKEFTIKTNLTRTISEFQKGSISADQFRNRLNKVHKEVIKASGISNLTTKLDVLEKELASGSMTMNQYTMKLRQLGIEANKLGNIKTFGLGAVSTKGFVESYKGMSDLNKLYSSNIDQMSKMGIKSMDQVFNLVRDPRAWDEFAFNMTKSYSKFDSQTKKISNQFGKLVDQLSTPIRKVSVGISQSAMEKDFIKQTKSMSVLKESWRGFAEGVGFGTSKLTNWFKTMRRVVSGVIPQIKSFDSLFSRAVARRFALDKVALGFRGVGKAARGAAIAVKGFLASTIALLALSIAVQKAFEWFEKLSRGTEYYAQMLGTTNAEFNKLTASLTGNISGIIRYADKLNELRKSVSTDLKINADIKTEKFNKDLSHLRGLLEGTAQFENFEFNVKYGTVTDAIIAWRDLNDVIVNLKEETSNKAIGRFVELGSEYKKASEIYKNTITTALEGSWLKSTWGSLRGKEKSTSLKIKIEDLSDSDKVKFKRQGQEAAKLMIDSAKVVLQQGATTFDLVWDKNSVTTFDRQLDDVFKSTTLFGDSLETTKLKFNDFIARIKQNVKTVELFDQFKEVGKNLNKVFQVEGANEFATFMKMFPNLASESRDEVKGLADSWASLGEDERAVVLIDAARRDLKLFHKSMKAISADGSMLQAADSTKKFVETAAADISMLNTSIAQMGGTVAREFESTWSRTWGQWVNEGVTASLDIDKALTGSFEYGSKSVLGKLERSISKTTDPIIKSFTSAYTKIGSTWAKETSKMIKDNKLPKAFSNWGNELRVALTSPWAKARSAQDEWRSGMNNAVNATIMRFNLLQESMSKMGSLVSEEWRRAQSTIPNNTSFGSEKDGEDAIEKFTDGIEKSLKAAIKSGHKGIQDLAKAMSGDVAGAIDLTIKRMEHLNSIIAQAKSLSIEVKDAISKWESGATLTNQVLNVTLDYLKKFAKNADISKTVRDMNVALLRSERSKAKEAFERGKSLGVSDEDKLKGAKTYLERLDQINKKLMSSAVESLKKHLSDKAKAEKKEMIERHKRENDAAKKSQALRKISYRKEIKDAKIQAAAMKKIEKLRWKEPGNRPDINQKIENEKMWGDRSQKENEYYNEMLTQQKKFDDDAAKARKERQAAELKALEESGGKTAKSMQKLAKVLADIDSGELKIKNIDELVSRIASLGDPELTKNFKLYLNEIKNTNVEISNVGTEAKEVANRAEKSRLETKNALKNLVSLQEKLTKYSETVSKQSEVIADLLKREGLTQAIQALSVMGFNVELDKKGLFKDDNTLKMFNKLIGRASDGLVDAANKLQTQVQPIKAFNKTPVKKEDIVSDISRQLLNLSKSFPEAGSHIDELSTQFLIQLDRMKASGKTQEEIDSRLSVVLSSITDISDDAKNLDTTSMGSYLDDITNMLKITSSDLKQIDTSNIQPSTTKVLLQEKIQPTASEIALKNIQKNQSKLDSFVNELPQWIEVADKVEKVAVSSFEDVSQSYQRYFDNLSKKDQEGYLIRDDFRLRQGKLQTSTAQADVVLGKMTPIDITKILDADTFQTTIDGVAVDLRLAFIDALESSQAGSALQTEEMKNLISEYKKSGYDIQAFFKEYDKESNRLISTIYATKDGESIDINQEAIARGIAKVFVPKGIISSEDKNVVQSYSKIQEAAKQMSAGIHGFSQWLSTTYPNMAMQLPENFREIIGRGDEIDIRTVLENESKLKAAFNEYLDKLGKSPIYTEEEMTVTDDAVDQLLKLGSTKGSIFVHDAHLDETIKNLFSAIKATDVDYKTQQMPEINPGVPGDSIKNATVKLEESTFKVSELMQNLEGVFDQNFIKTLLDAFPTTQDTTENLMDKLTQEFSDLRSVFVEGVQSIISAIISKQLVVNLPNNNEMANNIKKFTDQATEKGSIFTHDIHSESAIVDSVKQSKEGLSKVAKAQSETSVRVGNYIFELDKANDRIFPAATTSVFGVEGLAYEKFKALEFKIPDEDVKGLSEGIVNSMKQYAAQDKRRSETTLPSKDWSDQEYRSLKLTNAFDTVIPQLYDTVAELSKSVPKSAYKEMISAVNDASMTLSNFSREKLESSQSIVYDVLMEARNKINSISQQSQIQTKLQPDNTSSRVGLIQESSNFINSMSKVTDQFNEKFLINNKLLNTIKSTDLSGSMFDRDKIKNLSMEIVNGMILIKDSTTGIAHGFKTAEEAAAKIGGATFNALKIKKREREFEISNPQYEASFQNPYEQPITYEVQGAQEIDAKISDESIQIFRDILTGDVYASNVGFTGGGRAAAAFESSREISNLMQGIEDTFGKSLTDALSNAFPSLGSQAQSSMVELSQKFTDLQTTLSSKGSTEANSEVQSFLSYLEGLSNKMGEVQSKMTVPSEKYTAQIEMFSDALNTIKTKVADFTLEAPKEAEVLSEATDDASTEMVESVVPMSNATKNSTESVNIFGSGLISSSADISEAISSAISIINTATANVRSSSVNMGFSQEGESSGLSMSEIADMVSQSLEDFSGSLDNAADEASDALGDMGNAANNVGDVLGSIQRPGARTGTILPGYGGGDYIPFNLEPGEAVINKEAVRMYGRDLFNAYNQGKAKAISKPSVGKRLTKVRSVVEKKLLNDDSPIRKFDINLAGVPFKGLATEDMINQLEKGLRRKQLVGQNI